MERSFLILLNLTEEPIFKNQSEVIAEPQVTVSSVTRIQSKDEEKIKEVGTVGFF